jgi:glucose dehydrogenase
MLRTPSLNLLLQIKDGDRCEWIDTRDTMEPTLGRVIGAFTTAATVATLMITGVDHQAVEAGTKDQKAYTTWSDYEGSADSAQYSSLTQINKSNVAKLRQMWFYPAGNNGFRFGFNPLVVDGVMYVVGKNNATVALDAVTGKEIWVHDNGTPRNITNRGINYWESTAGFSIPRTTFFMRLMPAPANLWTALAITATSICAKAWAGILRQCVPLNPGRRAGYSKIS